MAYVNQNEVQFILSQLPLGKNLRSTLVALPFGGYIDAEAADQIREMCIDTLDVIAFDENYLPTPEGRILESLIDKLHVHV